MHTKLTPAMRSRKALVLDFVTAFIGEHNGMSPSYGEIAAGCGVSRERARELVTALVVHGKLRREAGRTRGLSLPSAIEQAVRELQAAGWHVITGASIAQQLPYGAIPLTFSTLPRMPDLDQIAEGDGRGGDDELGTKRSGPEGPANDRGPVPGRRSRRSPRGSSAAPRAA